MTFFYQKNKRNKQIVNLHKIALIKYLILLVIIQNPLFVFINNKFNVKNKFNSHICTHQVHELQISLVNFAIELPNEPYK